MIYIYVYIWKMSYWDCHVAPHDNIEERAHSLRDIIIIYCPLSLSLYIYIYIYI